MDVSRQVLRSILLVTSMLAWGGLMTACPGPDWPKCENDDHCKTKGDVDVNWVCVFGQCQECGRDSDCVGDLKCKGYRCVEVCKTSADCDDGKTCNEAGDCVAPPKSETKGGSGAACAETDDCKSGFECFKGKCTDAATVAAMRNEGQSTSVDCSKDGQVFFDFNVYDLTPEAREELDRVAKCLEQNASWTLTVEGHCDERGTTQYNLDLGDKRARSVETYLTRLGIAQKRIRTVSYGEERPLDASSNESAWAKNRRGELKLKR